MKLTKLNKKINTECDSNSMARTFKASVLMSSKLISSSIPPHHRWCSRSWALSPSSSRRRHRSAFGATPTPTPTFQPTQLVSEPSLSSLVVEFT